MDDEGGLDTLASKRCPVAHTVINCLIHVVFSTRSRTPSISRHWQTRLHGMLASIGNNRGFPLLVVGGVTDHVHLLLSLPGDRTISECIRILKSTSSKWVNDEFFPNRTFAWQEGYGAFAVSPSLLEATTTYIRNQEEHHQRRSFQRTYTVL
jgi:REP element-mobilizing transposase RayT